MGIPLCCMSERNEINSRNSENNIKQCLPYQISNNDDRTNKIIKIQSFVRGILSVNKFNSHFDSIKSHITQELEQKKLINENNITECESHLIYSQLISEKKILPFSEQLKQNEEFNNLYLKMSKYSFNIPHYIVTSPGEVYKGSWNVNKRYHGHGVKYEFYEKMTKNKRIEGMFYDGFLLGQGLVIFSNGEIIQGNFIKNHLDGNGEHYRKDKSVYKGEFKNGKYNGIGREIFADGSIFEGFFSEGQKKYGKLEFKNGSIYKGEFLNNLFHGKGIYNWANKKSYDGNWKDGKMNGKGKYIYPDGTIYEGEFLDGEKNGFGKCIWEKERYYEGKWKNNKRNGYGIYINKNKIKKGIWVDGKILNKNFEIIKKINTYLNQSKSRNETPIKKGVTHENFYHKNNLTEKKSKINQLNFNPTAKGKIIKNNYKTHLNNNMNRNQNSMYSIESTNTVKSLNNHVETKSSGDE